ncbi:hypothetical protein GGI15_003673 [Coemansia interrupta]|uniref:RRM domain-containing protein n=1 Tax=Coemansia interrupta TaxID=1126814 RepID=A0A9W8LFZ5_9FUNG|nr:hypothetical protein GGI15_003673 [Coemansia interrupta]
MQLNNRLDQSLDEIIRESRVERSKAGKPKPKNASKTRAAKALLTKKNDDTKAKPTRRVKNKPAEPKVTALISPSAKKRLAARLGTAGLTSKSSLTARKGGAMAGRIGKASRGETSGRGAAVTAADKRKREAELRQKIAKVAKAGKGKAFSIKGEAGPASIFISNLDTGASAGDVTSCFKQFGAIKACTLLYDRNGKPSGHAELTFSSKASAMEAVAKFDNAMADGRRLSVRLIPADQAPQIPSPVVDEGVATRSNAGPGVNPQFDMGPGPSTRDQYARQHYAPDHGYGRRGNRRGYSGQRMDID